MYLIRTAERMFIAHSVEVHKSFCTMQRCYELLALEAGTRLKLVKKKLGGHLICSPELSKAEVVFEEVTDIGVDNIDITILVTKVNN